MILNKGIDFYAFKKRATKEDLDLISTKEKQQINYFNTIKHNITDKISKLNKDINIAVFSSVNCPDAATATPLLIEISKLNKNIHINFYNKEDYTDYLIENLNESKVPTILNIDCNGNIVSKYCEFPVSLKKKLSHIEYREDADDIITDFRNGKFNDVLLNELVELILGTNQTDYISFDKTKLPYRNETNK